MHSLVLRRITCILLIYLKLSVTPLYQNIFHRCKSLHTRYIIVDCHENSWRFLTFSGFLLTEYNYKHTCEFWGLFKVVWLRFPFFWGIRRYHIPEEPNLHRKNKKKKLNAFFYFYNRLHRVRGLHFCGRPTDIIFELFKICI